MTYQPPIQPMYPGGNREQTQAWEDLLGLLNQQYRQQLNQEYFQLMRLELHQHRRRVRQ
jgi:Trp operon repressor